MLLGRVAPLVGSQGVYHSKQLLKTLHREGNVTWDRSQGVSRGNSLLCAAEVGDGGQLTSSMISDMKEKVCSELIGDIGIH